MSQQPPPRHRSLERAPFFDVGEATTPSGPFTGAAVGPFRSLSEISATGPPNGSTAVLEFPATEAPSTPRHSASTSLRAAPPPNQPADQPNPRAWWTSDQNYLNASRNPPPSPQPQESLQPQASLPVGPPSPLPVRPSEPLPRAELPPPTSSAPVVLQPPAPPQSEPPALPQSQPSAPPARAVQTQALTPGPRTKPARAAKPPTTPISPYALSKADVTTPVRRPPERRSTGPDRETEGSPARTSTDIGPAVLLVAARYLGAQYRYGGMSPRGFDCSGFTGYVYRQFWIFLPRTAHQQMQVTPRVPRTQARIGDLVFFLSAGRAFHVGIYAGNGLMYDAPRPGRTVQRQAIWSAGAVYGRVRR